MHPSPQPRRSLPVWLSAGVWLSAFLSPTAYFLLLLLANKFQVPMPPVIFVAFLFLLIPALALLVCGHVVWSSNMTLAGKIGWMLFTVLGMLLQFGFLMAIVRAILITVTGYAQ